MCKHLRVCVSMCVLTHHICVWRPEVSLTPQFSTLILDAGFLTAPELTNWVDQLGHWAPGLHLSPAHTQGWGYRSAAWPNFSISAGDSDSGPHPCAVRSLLTEPSSKPKMF